MKILIADDHWVVRETLKQVIRQIGRTDGLIEASSFGDVMQTLETEHDISLILLDLVMPDFEAFDGLRALRRKVPHVPVVVISVHEDRDYVMRTISYGVVGYIPKTAAPAEVKSALMLVLDGHVSFPREILQQGEEATQRNAVNPAGLHRAAPARLTERETDVLKLLGQGATVTHIAELLALSPRTVRVHIANMMKRLDIGNRSALIHYAISRHGERG